MPTKRLVSHDMLWSAILPVKGALFAFSTLLLLEIRLLVSLVQTPQSVWTHNQALGQNCNRLIIYMGVSKDRVKTPKMDGENNGKSYFLMDDLGGKTPIFGNIHMYISNFKEKTSARPLDLLFPDLHTMTDVAYKAWPQRHEKSYFGDLAGKKEKGYPSVEEMALFLSRKCILIMMVFQDCH